MGWFDLVFRAEKAERQGEEEGMVKGTPTASCPEAGSDQRREETARRSLTLK